MRRLRDGVSGGALKALLDGVDGKGRDPYGAALDILGDEGRLAAVHARDDDR